MGGGWAGGGRRGDGRGDRREEWRGWGRVRGEGYLRPQQHGGGEWGQSERRGGKIGGDGGEQGGEGLLRPQRHGDGEWHEERMGGEMGSGGEDGKGDVQGASQARLIVL